MVNDLFVIRGTPLWLPPARHPLRKKGILWGHPTPRQGDTRPPAPPPESLQRGQTLSDFISSYVCPP